MANIKSQKKRIKTNEKSRQRNVSIRSRVKTFVQKAEKAIESNDAEQIQSAVKTAITELDRAATKGVLHANSVARKKSTLARLAQKSQNS